MLKIKKNSNDIFTLNKLKKNNLEIKLVQKFIDKNFKKNHILSKNKKVFDWLYYNNYEKKYNFIIEQKNTRIISFLGIVKNSKFSKKLKKNESVWFATWVAKKNEIGAGLKLLSHAIKNYTYIKIGTIGYQDNVKQFYKYLGFFTGHLTQYYISNSKNKNNKIIQKKKDFIKKIKTNTYGKSINLKIVKTINFNKFRHNKHKYIKLFSKDENFFRNKYLRNPFYNYVVYEFRINKKLQGYYFTREAKYKNSKCLRIVDYFGNINSLFRSSVGFNQIIEDKNYEFVDMFFFTNSNFKINQCKFKKNNYKNNLIIPNFFEPFVKKNIKINFAILTKKVNKFFLFKGDCDQERPNILRS